MGILVLDAGNTRVTARRLATAEQWPSHPAAGGGAQPVPLEDLGDHATPGDDIGRGKFTSWLQELPRKNGDRLVLVTVVPALSALVRTVLPDVIGVDHRSPLPYALAVDDPAAVGPDRYCNMAAAHLAGLSDALVIDAGTATTFDLLSAGTFVGGIIAPGMGLAGDALASGTTRLPHVPVTAAPLAAAPDTRGAMVAGIWHAGRGGIREIRDGLLAYHGPRPVIVTGGLGAHLDDLGWLDPDWTLRGAAGIVAGPDAAFP